MPEDMPDKVPECLPDRRPEDLPDNMPDRMPDRMLEDMPEHMPEDMPGGMPEDMPDRMPEGMPDKVPECLPDRMPEDLPNNMPEDMPDRMPDMPDRMPDRMPEDMPDRMPEGMPDRMPNKMSDRMPEDLPVTKCINVMVGITRSKVIYFFCVCVFNMPAPTPGISVKNEPIGSAFGWRLWKQLLPWPLCSESRWGDRWTAVQLGHCPKGHHRYHRDVLSFHLSSHFRWEGLFVWPSPSSTSSLLSNSSPCLLLPIL